MKSEWNDPPIMIEPDGQREPEPGAESAPPSAALDELLSQTRFDHTKNMPDPEPRLWLGEVVVATPGNIVTLSAAIKAGKSAACEAILAAALADDPELTDTFGFKTCNPRGHAVVHFDTEQPPAQHYRMIRRALRRAGVMAPPSWFHSFGLLGKPTLTVKAALFRAVEGAGDTCGGVHLVIVDGIGDLAIDLNDQKEAMPLVAELHDLAIRFDTVIVVVIHTNPGSEKTRGHLGSHLERKAESNLRLEKDKDDVTVIYSTGNRGAPIPKDKGPCFRWDDTAGMHASVDNTTRKPGRGPKATVEQVVALLTKNGLLVADWRTKAKEQLGIERTAFFNAKADALAARLVTQSAIDERWFKA